MSSEDILLTVKKRDVLGKQVRALRREGNIPAVIHERGKASQHVVVDSAAFKKAFHKAGKHHAIKVDVDGKKHTTIIKDVTNAPARSEYYHAVFQAISEHELVTAEIPVKLSEEIPAERANLLVLKHIEHIAVEALPKDLIDVIEIDASSLAEVGDKLHVSDIKVPDTITIKAEPDQTIVTVEMPKDQVAEADAALAEQEAADGAASGEEAGEPGEEDNIDKEASEAQSSTSGETDSAAEPKE